MKIGSAALIPAAAFTLTLAAAGASAQDRLWLSDGPASTIGVATVELSEEAAKQRNVERGVVIERVQPNGPAARAGFQAGDVVVEFDGEPVRSTRQFARVVRETAPNRQVVAIVVRNGARQTLRVTPELGRADLPLTLGPMTKQGALRPFGPDTFSLEGWFAPSSGRLGAAVMPLDDQLAAYFGTTDGVLVTSVNANSPAARAGLRAGDVIVEVAGRRIAEPGEVVEALRSGEAGGEVRIGIVRDKQSMTLTATLPQPERPRTLRNGVSI